MLRPIVTLIGSCVCVASLAFVARAAAPASETEFRAHVERLVAEGRIDFEQGMLYRMQRAFAPSELPADLRSATPWPFKSVSMLVREYETLRASFSPAATGAIDGFLSLPASTHSLATAHFQFDYDTAGPHAVPLADVSPANGIPDFVERVAAYAELSWTRLFVDVGFTPPAVGSSGYVVRFREMSAYGYTMTVEGTTEIILHRSFAAFPGNDDPDGSQLGAAKVTMAHELKHASQFASSGWTEGGWLEADATWAEEFVFPATNDYLRYLPYGSPVSDPGNWLPNGTASYEDCLWPELIESLLGVEALVSFFERRSQYPTEGVTAAYDAVLRERNSSLASACDALGVWSFFAGANAAGRPAGFDEAESFPTPPYASVFTPPSTVATATISGMGSNYLVASPSGRTGKAIVSFAGDRQRPLAAHVTVLTHAGARPIWTIPLSASNTGSLEVPWDWQEIAFVVVSVTNLGAPGSPSSYVVTVGDPNAVGVEGLGSTSALVLEPNRPNPFRSATAISFSIPSADEVRLGIYDVTGRLVRRLIDERRLAAGAHERTWDGLDERGRPAAPGVYYYRLETSADSGTRKMLLLR